MARVTGVPGLDSLASPVPGRGWIVEFYGDRDPVGLAAHHAVAEAARRGLVAVVHVQDFGGFDPYLASRLARARGASPDSILIARAFRLVDVPGLVEEAAETGARTVVVVDPYRFAPRTPRGYHLLTRVTASLRRAAGSALVVVANRASRFGRGLSPEGGSFHHHSVHVMIRLRARRRGVEAVLVKHPARPAPRTALIAWPELGVEWLWVGRPRLDDYL